MVMRSQVILLPINQLLVSVLTLCSSDDSSFSPPYLITSREIITSSSVGTTNTFTGEWG